MESYKEEGSHHINPPEDYASFEETLVLADHLPGSNGFDKMSRAIFAFNWLRKEMTVIPQDWFNQGNYDFGYQWITRVARLSDGGIVGDGIRLGAFELDETGKQVKRWITSDPFHMHS